MAEEDIVTTGVPGGGTTETGRLSEIGQMYDINGDGVLDETERASRLHISVV